MSKVLITVLIFTIYYYLLVFDIYIKYFIIPKEITFSNWNSIEQMHLFLKQYKMIFILNLVNCALINNVFSYKTDKMFT